MITIVEETIIDLVKSRVRKGIPIGLRHSVWPVLCSFDTLKQEKDFNYDVLSKTYEYQFKEMIEMDVKRVCEKEEIAPMNIKQVNIDIYTNRQQL